MISALWRLARELPRDLVQQLISAEPQPDPLQEVVRLRRENPSWSAEFASAISVQRSLNHKARNQCLLPSNGWLLTAVGLEQSSPPEVARLRAQRISRAHTSLVVDATTGIGVDAWSLADSGLAVVGFDRDVIVSAICQFNVPQAAIMCSDAVSPGLALEKLPKDSTLYLDPARRDKPRPINGARALPERDPERWSPPWSFVENLTRIHPAVAAKAPGSFTPPSHWTVEWVGFGRDGVECVAYSEGLPALELRRQATLISPSGVVTLPASDGRPPSGPVADFVGEPHPVWRRSLEALCHNGTCCLHDGSSWITADYPYGTGIQWFRTIDQLPVNQIKAAARSRGITEVAIKCREAKADLNDLRARIGLPDGQKFAVIVTQLPHAILAERVGLTPQDMAVRHPNDE